MADLILIQESLTNEAINPDNPPTQIVVNFYTVSSEALQLALTVKTGDYCKRTDLAKTYIALNSTNDSMSDWFEVVTPSGSGTTDHSALSNLTWGNSGHTGTANNFPIFGSNGVASLFPKNSTVQRCYFLFAGAISSGTQTVGSTEDAGYFLYISGNGATGTRSGNWDVPAQFAGGLKFAHYAKANTTAGSMALAVFVNGVAVSGLTTKTVTTGSWNRYEWDIPNVVAGDTLRFTFTFTCGSTGAPTLFFKNQHIDYNEYIFSQT